MSNNAMTLFGGSNVPAHILAKQQALAGTAADIQPRVSIPSLLVTGKVWTVNADGQKVKMVSRNAEGDEIPASVMRVIIVGYNKSRGRTYYEGSYDPDKEAMPLCRSRDGKVPDDDVEEKQSPACQTCRWAAKGSKVDDRGKPTVACSQHRILVVASPKTLRPMRLKIAITSDYDKQGVHHQKQGWYAFQQYTDFLYANGLKTAALIVTKMKFDPDAAYPKILFAPDQYLDAEVADKAVELAMSEEVKAMLARTMLDAVVGGKDPEAEGYDGPADEAGDEAEPAPKAAPKAPPRPTVAAAPPKAAPVRAAPKAEPKAEPKSAPKSVPKPAPEAAAPVDVDPAPAGIDDILSEWG